MGNFYSDSLIRALDWERDRFLTSIIHKFPEHIQASYRLLGFEALPKCAVTRHMFGRYTLAQYGGGPVFGDITKQVNMFERTCFIEIKKLLDDIGWAFFPKKRRKTKLPSPKVIRKERVRRRRQKRKKK